MRYKRLGNSGLKVSELCLGAMTFGEEWGWGSSKEESRRVFDTYVEAGGNFIDTANSYTNGTSERYVGEFIAAERERYVVATKYTLTGRPEDVNGGGNHRKNLIQSLDASLKRLNTDYIDLYWVHVWDAITPVEEMMRALDDQVKLGKILYVGISDVPAWVVARANTLAQWYGWTPFIALQIQYNLIERSAERELLPMSKALDIGVTSWSPLGGGILTGKYNLEDQGPKRYTPDNPWTAPNLTGKKLAIAQRVIDVANDMSVSPSQVALNWIRQQNHRSTLIPIVGARTVKQLKENLGYLDFDLSPRHLEKLEEASKISLGFPHDFLELETVQNMVHGNIRLT